MAGERHDYFVPGERAVRELLGAAPKRVRKLWIAAQRSDELAAWATSLGVTVEVCSEETIRERAPGIEARGVLALADPPALRALDELITATLESAAAPRIIVALDGVLDPQNLGAILRSCEFFGVSGVFWAKDRSAPLSPAAIRTSAGASERIAMAQVTNFATALTECREAGLWVVGTVADEGQDLAVASLRDAIPEPLVLVMGGEEKGIRRLTRERCDLLVTISRRGALGSLNVAAATAAALALLLARAGSDAGAESRG